MAFENCVLLKTEYPTYLLHIFREQQEITLIHAKNLIHEEEPTILSPDALKTDVSCLDLTGNPLMLDLKGEDDCNETVCVGQQQPNNWTDEETQHYPVEVKDARTLLNTLNRKQGLTSNTRDDKLAPMVYCVCNPQEPNNLALLGSNPLTNTRVMIHLRGCHPRSHPSMNISNMVEKHNENCGDNSAISSTVCTKYSIFGYHLRNTKNFPVMQTFGSILLETSWNSLRYEPLDVNNTKLKLQIITGLIDSPLNTFWVQLALIQRFLDFISDSETDMDEIKICYDPMTTCDVFQTLKKIMEQNKNRSILKKKKLQFAELDFSKLRCGEFYDELWELLIKCENVTDIRECLIFLFEECSQGVTTSFKVPDNNPTSVGNILKSILEGTLAVPTITSTQALMYTVELGLQKLRNDYFFIMESIDQLQVQDFEKQWFKLATESVTKSLNPLVAMESSRMTIAQKLNRMTIAKGTTKLDVTSIVEQLNFLANLHVNIQFLHLAKTNNLPLQLFKYIIKGLFSRNSTTKLSSFKTLQNNGLCEIDIDVFEPDLNWLKTLNVVSWNLKMSSTEWNSDVTTIFHHSEKPIMPSTINKNYTISLEDNVEKMFFVTEAIVWTG